MSRDKSLIRKDKVKIVLVQLGSPKTPKVSHVRSYLREFLGDPRVVDINPILWKIILNLFVLPFRPKKSAEAYSRIWDGEKFPLIENTRTMANAVSEELASDDIEVNYAFLLSYPRVGDVLDSWEKEIEEGKDAAGKVLAVPMFPQYSEATIASGIDGLGAELGSRVNIPDLQILTSFHDSHAFIDESVKQIEEYLIKFQKDGAVDRLIISFHGIPKRRVIYKKDVYYRHCFETYKLIKDRVKSISVDKIEMTFQSRFGGEEWLTPYTDKRSLELVEQGHKRIAYYCPSFVADCLETTDEIGQELEEELAEEGGEVLFIPCLNDKKSWAQSFSKFLMGRLHGRPTNEDHYHLEKEDYKEMEEVKMSSPPLDPNAKKTIKIVFLTLFLDLVGFSIIFPLFPSLAKYYLEVDADNVFLKAIFGTIETLTSAGGSNFSSIVLFGGALGALYSLLQFIAAPFWGSLSDKIGRKPVLIISVSGLALSYLLWFVSGSFTVLVIARLIGGIMGGNISTATAVVADVTTKENRSRGMAFIGIAFALGFIIGPAMGGLLSFIDLTKIYPILIEYGVNPFSMPAIIAFILSLFNVYWLITQFKESLPEEKRGKVVNTRSNNPLVLFKPLPYAGLNLTNFGHFLFLMAFSGMEFTLTFLALERLGYSSMDNAYMFIFIGFIIALVQGGYVRRKARIVGEKKMAIQGIVFSIPGLLLISFATNNFLLYGGLFFLAVGSSMAIPCLTSLISLYTPAEEQGRSIGVFRSLGALARVIGPVLASLVYWKWGAAWPYWLGSLFLIIPILMLIKLPKPLQESH